MGIFTLLKKVDSIKVLYQQNGLSESLAKSMKKRL